MGTNCAPLIADFFIFCNERDFMFQLHKSKWCAIVDDTSRYLDDIFTNDNPECEKNISNILRTCSDPFFFSSRSKKIQFDDINSVVVFSYRLMTHFFSETINLCLRLRSAAVLVMFIFA